MTGPRLDQAKDELLSRAAAACAPDLADLGAEIDLLDYLRLYYRHVAAEDLLTRDPRELCGPAVYHLQLARERPQGRANVRCYTPTIEDQGFDTGHSVLEIVTDDMPYLVDSVTAELNRKDVGTHLIVHPQLRVRRDVAGGLHAIRGPVHPVPAEEAGGGALMSAEEADESWMYIEIDRVTDPQRLRELESDLQRVLIDVRYAAEDSARMQSLATRLAAEFVTAPPPVPAEEVETAVELLGWLADGHFTFLGYREYDLVMTDEGETLRAVPGTGLGILRSDKARSDAFASLPPEARAKAREHHLLVLTKANSRATVHRPHYLDYIGLKKFDAAGDVVGERRFLGLFTHLAYSESIARIPVLRRKLAAVLARAGVSPTSHDGKNLTEILETYPRDELFQISPEELVPIALGVLRLRERRQTRLFLRADPYGRYMSCLVYLPRDRYTTQIRLRIIEILRQAFDGTSVDFSAMVGDVMFARLHVVVRVDRGKPLPSIPTGELESRIIAATRSWDDDFAAAAVEQCGEERGGELLRRYHGGFTEGYKSDVAPRTAVADVKRLDELAEPGEIGLNLYAPFAARDGERRLKIYRVGGPITLSAVLPQLQHMGVEVVDERPYEVTRTGGERAWIYDFGLRYEPSAHSDEQEMRARFQDAFAALWRGDVESDGFNALVLHAGLTWRQAMLLRAYVKYLRQAGLTFSQIYVERVLRAHVHITRLLVQLFESRLDPSRDAGRDERCAALAEELLGELDGVDSLDDDRILRTLLAAVQATLRTNYYQPADAWPSGRRPGEPAGSTAAAPDPPGSQPGSVDGRRAAADAPWYKPHLTLKFDPAGIPDLPLPRPRFEVFVYSPRVEGVHLRFGAVARGGLRWSDRREDFRTEILGLVKAQTVKNAVIVPSGAKGGFVVKGPVDHTDREAFLAEGVACYRTFICGLLDITDNLAGGEVVPPPGVVRHDGDDPYLVVAADKGTATFSDIANEIAASYGFWLGDAFASGGSVGYDHKAMGITARGAWESVKYHFRSLGVDVQTDDVTAVGIGDMSGDVFGNGMLLSRSLRLLAAFDHRHIFLDPAPDPGAAYAERARLFELPRSSWADYDPALISAGGGVHPRTAKSVPVTPEVREVLGLDPDVRSLTPHELIRAILCAPVDLLWNGGIGTYVKATAESHADIGDKANDALRVDAAGLRCRVIGEGGNLGLSQLARIEYALAGGLVNTDFIDNTAGVDTSDHEVNIKILLDRVVRAGELSRRQRDELLLDMTGEVAALVLKDNYQQNVCLAAARAQAPEMLHVHARYMRKMERDGRLIRELEFLPGDKVIAERRAAGLGLTGPEFAVLLAYTKIGMADELLSSELPDDPSLRGALVSYFPRPLRQRFADWMDGHPLRREIICNHVVNELVNRSGTTFAFRINEETGASVPDIVAAYLISRAVFDMQSFSRAVEDAGRTVDTATQIAMQLEGRKLIERATRWLLHFRRPPFDIQAEVDFFTPGVSMIAPHLPKLLSGRDLVGFEERRDGFAARGVSAELAERVAGMVPAYSTFDLVEIAHRTERSVQEVAEVYFDLADRLQLSRLRERVIMLPRDDRWNTMARAALRDDLYAAHAAITRDVLTVTGSGTPEERLAAWTERNAAAVARSRQTLTEIWESDRFTVATLSVALRAIRTLVAASTLPRA